MRSPIVKVLVEFVYIICDKHQSVMFCRTIYIFKIYVRYAHVIKPAIKFIIFLPVHNLRQKNVLMLNKYAYIFVS